MTQRTITKKDKHAIIFPPENKAPYHTGNIFTWMGYFLSPYKWQLIAFAAWRITRYTILSLPPVLIGLLINAINDGSIHDHMNGYIYGMIAFAFLYLLFLYNAIFISEINFIERAARSMTIFSINHLNTLSMLWHESQGSGKSYNAL